MLTLAGAVVLAQPRWIGPALGLLGAIFVAHLFVSDPSDVAPAGLAGIALLAAGELAQWSIDARQGGRYERRSQVARARGIGALLLGGVAVVLLAGIAAALPISGGIELMLVATAAAVTLFGLTAFATRGVSR